MPRPEKNAQTAPYPAELEELIGQLYYRPGWRFALGTIERDPASTHGSSAGGLTFIATTNTLDSYDHHRHIAVNHYFPVPAATYNRASWQRWLLNCLLLVEQHECCEFFTIDGAKPFAPLHGPGEDPYRIVEYATDTQRRTSFRGVVADA